MSPTSTGRLDFQGYAPGTIGRIVEAHAVYYHEHWGFDASFETQVARELSEFVSEFQVDRDGLWVTLFDGRFAGSIAIDGKRADTEGARLRWFIVVPTHQGCGIGRALIQEAVAFLPAQGISFYFPVDLRGADPCPRAVRRDRICASSRSMRCDNGGSRSPDGNSVLNPGRCYGIQGPKKKRLCSTPKRWSADRFRANAARPPDRKNRAVCAWHEVAVGKARLRAKIVAGTEKTCFSPRRACR